MTDNSKRWPELPPEVVEIIKRPKEIICIECCKHYVSFYLKDGHCYAFRLPLCQVLYWLSCQRFLRIHQCVVINMHCLNGPKQGKPDWKVRMINGNEYSISSPYREDFMRKRHYMLGIQQKRVKIMAKVDKVYTTSRWDI